MNKQSNTAQHEPKVGERFYYTGDMANADGFGVVVSIESTKWGTNIRCRFDARYERAEFVVHPSSFHPGPGRRFWREVEYRQDRAMRIAEFTKEPIDVILAKMDAADVERAQVDAQRDANAQRDPN